MGTAQGTEAFEIELAANEAANFLVRPHAKMAARAIGERTGRDVLVWDTDGNFVWGWDRARGREVVS